LGVKSCLYRITTLLTALPSVADITHAGACASLAVDKRTLLPTGPDLRRLERSSLVAHLFDHFVGKPAPMAAHRGQAPYGVHVGDQLKRGRDNRVQPCGSIEATNVETKSAMMWIVSITGGVAPA